jgi:hypothetical protein
VTECLFGGMDEVISFDLEHSGKQMSKYGSVARFKLKILYST